MIYRGIQGLLPAPLRRYVLHFEAAIEQAAGDFARSLPDAARVLDAGAGEGSYKHLFGRQRYTGIDLGIGDTGWNYAGLDAIADLEAIPFSEGVFDAAVNIVTLEHVREPARVMAELARVLRPGGRLLLIVPHEWEEHQQPHDFFRYTRHGVAHLFQRAGLETSSVTPVGGFFRLLSRRLFNALQFFPGLLMPVAALFFVPPALLLPLFEPFDRRQNFTLGFICIARKPSS